MTQNAKIVSIFLQTAVIAPRWEHRKSKGLGHQSKWSNDASLAHGCGNLNGIVTTPLTLADWRVNEATAIEREQLLRKEIRTLGGLVTGYSGGVDSTYLCVIAHQELGDRARAAIAVSPSLPHREWTDAVRMAAQHGFPVDVPDTEEHLRAGYIENSGNRCYHCKDELFIHLRRFAESQSIPYIAFGAIMDDIGDHRPGAVAAREHGALAPLQNAGLNKREIRFLSRKLGIDAWSKPAMACLASRVQYGIPVTPELLARIEEAENIIKDLGYADVRVRHHGAIARIELGANELPTFFTNGHHVHCGTAIKALGWDFVTIDVLGYKSGSMNALLSRDEEA